MSKNTLLSELINYVSANSSGNVTIAAPVSGYALNVSGTGKFTNSLELEGSGYVYTSLYDGGSTTTLASFYNYFTMTNQYSGKPTTDFLAYDYLNQELSLGTNGTTKLTIKSSGNVGIGTTAPSFKLQVEGDTYGTTGFFVRNTANTFLGSLNNTSGMIVNGTTYNTTIVSGGNYTMTLTTAGNVLIGTTTDSGYKLDVTGTGRFTSALYVSNTNGTGVVNAYSGTSVGTYIAKSQSATANFVTTGVLYPRGLGYGAIVGAGNTTDIPVNNSAWGGGYGGNIGFWSDIHYGVEGGTNSIGYNAVIRGSGDSSSFGFFADLSGAVGGSRYGIYTKGEAKNYFSGSVGIGTTSPSAKLNVSGITSGTSIRTDHTSDYSFLYSYINGASGIAFDNIGGNLAFYVNGAYRLRLDTSGNLGLGVTPSAWGTNYKSITSQNISLYGRTDDSDRAGIVVNGYYDNSLGFVYTNSAFATLYELQNGQHRWWVAPSGTAGTTISFTQAMTLFANGNLAVGTTTDSGYKLDVNGTGRFTGALTGTSITLSNSLNFTSIYGGNINGYDGTSLVSMNYNASQHQYYAGGTLKMMLLGNGNLLLGTTTDNGSKLQVSGAATFSSSVTANATSGNSYLSFRSQYDTDSNYRLDITQVVSAGLVKHAFNVVNAGTAYNNNLVLDRGNVGIGTASPTKPLYISSTVSDKLYLTGGTAQNGILLDSVGTSHQYYYGAGNNLLVGGDQGNLMAYDVTTGRAAVFFDTSNNIRFGTTASGEWMRLTNGGNLLIGTTTDSVAWRANINTSDSSVYIAHNAGYGMAIESKANNGTYLLILRGGDGSAIGNYQRFLFAANGTAYFNAYANGTLSVSSGQVVSSSDINLKIDDGGIDGGLEKVMKLNPRYFYWKEDSGISDTDRHLGFYAQEIQEALGYEVANCNSENKWGIYDRGIIAMLTKAIQEQQAQIEELKQLINN